MMRIKIKNISVIIFMLAFCSCYKNPIERNTIVFEDSNQAVQDSLLKMMRFLPNLAKNKKGLNTNYYIKGNEFYINSSCVGSLNNLELDTIIDLFKYSDKDRKEFVSIAKYLNKNHIDSGYFDGRVNLWIFEYRYLPDGDFHDTREIVYFNESDSSFLKSHSRILDHKKNIFLLAPKEAKIR